jgi:hypothetical protein
MKSGYETRPLVGAINPLDVLLRTKDRLAPDPSGIRGSRPAGASWRRRLWMGGIRSMTNDSRLSLSTVPGNAAELSGISHRASSWSDGSQHAH